MPFETVLIVVIAIFVVIYFIISLSIRLLGIYLNDDIPNKDLVIGRRKHNKMVKRVQNWMLNNNSTEKIVRKQTKTTHLFGLPKKATANQIDLTDFDRIVEVDLKKGVIHVQSQARANHIIKYLLQYGYCLAVVPDMDHLTVGGLFAGVGGGSASFKQGLFNESVINVELLDGNGNVIVDSSIIDSLSNSLGTLGYVLSFWLRIVPAKKYVHCRTEHFTTFKEFIDKNEYYLKHPNEIDFVDGTIFNPKEYVIITGRMVDEPRPNLPFMTGRRERPFFLNVQRGFNAMMKTYDYIYRWDADGYYSSAAMPSWVRNPILRRMIISDKLMTSSKLRKIFKMFGVPGFKDDVIEQEVADLVVPISRAEEYYNWFDANVGLYPLYMCPGHIKKTLLMKADEFSIDFGLGYGVMKGKTPEEKMENKHMCMTKAYEFGGDIFKYFHVFKNEAEFWSKYPDTVKEEYEAMKKRLDPKNRFYTISEKLV